MLYTLVDKYSNVGFREEKACLAVLSFSAGKDIILFMFSKGIYMAAPDRESLNACKIMLLVMISLPPLSIIQ